MAESDEERKPTGEHAPAEAGATPAAPEENRRARRAAKSKGKVERERERREAAMTGLDAGERVDDAFSRAADRSLKWLKEHFNIVQWLIVGGIASWIGFQIYTWRAEKAAAKVSDALASAIEAEQGKIAAADQEGKRDSRGELDVRRAFATDADRLKAAEDAYRKLSGSGSTSGGLAKLGLAGVLYDQGKYDDAQKLYSEVLGSELGKVDPDARGRSLEGIGICLEAKGDKDAALKKFGELENADIPGFRELAMYHQGRILHAKGDDGPAKEKLLKVTEKLGKEPSSPTEPPSYLLHAARDLLVRIDPSAAPPQSGDDALQKALEAAQKQLPPGMKMPPIGNGVPPLPEQ
jgi:tetratricopeptide (TPR) repeat protein